jgi:hypothetical protein
MPQSFTIPAAGATGAWRLVCFKYQAGQEPVRLLPCLVASPKASASVWLDRILLQRHVSPPSLRNTFYLRKRFPQPANDWQVAGRGAAHDTWEKVGCATRFILAHYPVVV